jgi:hypothetical protein
MIDLRSVATDETASSLAVGFRNRRFAHFEALCADLPRPISVLDIGGTNKFWEMRGWANRPEVQIVLVNLAQEPEIHSNIKSVRGDATDLANYADCEFDIVFSNSVIEHLFTWDMQARMAREVRRLGRAYWVQTPNFWFPIEPHFLVPGWQWMPESLRIAILRRRRCGWRGPCPDPEDARRTVREIRLLTRRQLRQLFPTAVIRPERFCGLNKSWIVHEGFPPDGKAGAVCACASPSGRCEGATS